MQLERPGEAQRVVAQLTGKARADGRVAAGDEAPVEAVQGVLDEGRAADCHGADIPHLPGSLRGSSG